MLTLSLSLLLFAAGIVTAGVDIVVVVVVTIETNVGRCSHLRCRLREKQLLSSTQWLTMENAYDVYNRIVEKATHSMDLIHGAQVQETGGNISIQHPHPPRK